MAFVQSLGGTEQVIIAGSFSHDVGTVRGTGFSVAVSSGVFTITLDRAYNGLISCTATVMNATSATGESLIAALKSHSVADEPLVEPSSSRQLMTPVTLKALQHLALKFTSVPFLMWIPDNFWIGGFGPRSTWSNYEEF